MVICLLLALARPCHFVEMTRYTCHGMVYNSMRIKGIHQVVKIWPWHAIPLFPLLLST